MVMLHRSGEHDLNTVHPYISISLAFILTEAFRMIVTLIRFLQGFIMVLWLVNGGRW